MKPDWDRLGDEYAGSSSVLIGDVDCTDEDGGRPLCEKFEVRGYPTIKSFVDGDTTDGEDYNGGRDFDSLKSHVEEKLEIKCLVEDTEGCSEKEIAYMEKMKAKGSEEILKQGRRLDGMKGDSMKPDLKRWLNQRLRILKQMHEEL